MIPNTNPSLNPFNPFNPYNYGNFFSNFPPPSDASQEETSEKFAERRRNAEANFIQLKISHSTLFNCAAIKQASSGKTYPSMINVEQDMIVVGPISKNPYLGTTGVGPYIAVGGRGYSDKDGHFIGLGLYGCVGKPEEFLEQFRKKLLVAGCELETIEFYFVGGQLPQNHDLEDIDSIDDEIAFLSLTDKYQIRGAQFNIIEDNDSLSVIISEKEIVWAHELIGSKRVPLIPLSYDEDILRVCPTSQDIANARNLLNLHSTQMILKLNAVRLLEFPEPIPVKQSESDFTSPNTKKRKLEEPNTRNVERRLS